MLSPDLRNIVSLLSGCPIPWAVCGGWAIDLFVNKVNRPHKDVDVTVFRRDQHVIHDYLNQRGWHLDVAFDGQLVTWTAGEAIQFPRHVIWCKHPDFEPDFLEVLLNVASDTHFLFRRNPSIQRDLALAFITSASGVPILAPEIALLYKSKRIEVENTAEDFHNVVPHMSAAQRNWLQQALRIE